MRSIPTSVRQPPPIFNFRTHEQLIGGHQLLFLLLDYSYTGSFHMTFPSVGYLFISFLATGNIRRQWDENTFLNVEPGYLYVSGLQSGPLVYYYEGKGRAFSIKIHPVIAYHLLKVPLHHLTDSQFAFSDILDKKGRLLRRLEANRQIDSHHNPYLAQFFRQVLPKKYSYLDDPIYHAVNLIIRKRGIITVKHLADYCCMSERTLNRQFLRKVGLPPKAYAKIWQVKYVMDLLRLDTEESLAQIAYQTGHYDVSHLVHDFESRLMKTPAEFREQLTPELEFYLNLP